MSDRYLSVYRLKNTISFFCVAAPIDKVSNESRARGEEAEGRKKNQAAHEERTQNHLINNISYRNLDIHT